jgi:hypothetical protein
VHSRWGHLFPQSDVLLLVPPICPHQEANPMGNLWNQLRITSCIFGNYLKPNPSSPVALGIKQCQNPPSRTVFRPYLPNRYSENYETWIDVLASFQGFERYQDLPEIRRKVQNRDIVSTTFHALRCPGQIGPNRPVCLLHEGKV